MIRPLTCLCLIAACGSGLYLYSEKHRTALLDREIGHVVRETQAARERTGLLRAEWALMNEPSRLQGLADKYLALKSMAPSQFVRLADLSTRLPPPVATPPEGSTDDSDAVADDSGASQAPAVVATAEPADPATIDLGETDIGKKTDAKADPKADAHKPVRHVSARQVAHLDPSLRSAHHTALADGEQSLIQRGLPLPLAAPQPVGASVYSAMARPIRLAMPRATIVSAQPAYSGPATAIGGSFNGRNALPPPVPYGAQ